MSDPRSRVQANRRVFVFEGHVPRSDEEPEPDELHVGSLAYRYDGCTFCGSAHHDVVDCPAR